MPRRPYDQHLLLRGRRAQLQSIGHILLLPAARYIHAQQHHRVVLVLHQESHDDVLRGAQQLFGVVGADLVGRVVQQRCQDRRCGLRDCVRDADNDEAERGTTCPDSPPATPRYPPRPRTLPLSAMMPASPIASSRYTHTDILGYTHAPYTHTLLHLLSGSLLIPRFKGFGVCT